MGWDGEETNERVGGRWALSSGSSCQEEEVQLACFER